MANLKQQKKRNRRTIKQRDTNVHYRSQIRTLFKRVEDALDAGDAEAAGARGAELTQLIDKAEAKHVLHRNNAARKKSRVARLLTAE
ncbi:MAG: 30S ribosomal protein S20 [Thermoleophilia bacterium]|nr:30S ribosomal protein S20 [Thermoleophilia bacterium]